MSETGEILNKALEALREHGWTTWQLQNSQGEMCALGALALALGCEFQDVSDTVRNYWAHPTPAWEAAIAALLAKIPDPKQRRSSASVVAGYNNNCTSFEDQIVPWFEKAIADEGVVV